VETAFTLREPTFVNTAVMTVRKLAPSDDAMTFRREFSLFAVSPTAAIVRFTHSSDFGKPFNNDSRKFPASIEKLSVFKRDFL
jgi:hypothetical protein